VPFLGKRLERSLRKVERGMRNKFTLGMVTMPQKDEDMTEE